MGAPGMQRMMDAPPPGMDRMMRAPGMQRMMETMMPGVPEAAERH